MEYVNSLAAGLQDHLEEMQRERECFGTAKAAAEGMRGNVNKEDKQGQQGAAPNP